MVQFAATLLRGVTAMFVGLLIAGGTLTLAADSSQVDRPTLVPVPPAPTRLTVPDVTGQAYVFAKGILQEHGFAWSVTGPVLGYAANTVSSELPLAGTVVLDTGAPTVTLVLARNRAYVQKGTPENNAPYPGTRIRIPATAGQLQRPRVAPRLEPVPVPPQPAGPASTQVLTLPTATTAAPSATTPSPTAPAAATPAPATPAPATPAPATPAPATPAPATPAPATPAPATPAPATPAPATPAPATPAPAAQTTATPPAAPTTPAAPATTPAVTPASPAAPATTPAVTPASPTAPATTPAPATPAGTSTPDFAVPGAPAQPAASASLPERVAALATFVETHRAPVAANLNHWLYEHAYIVAGARFGWTHGAEALQSLIAVDKRAEALWGVGNQTRTAAEKALAEVRARTG